MKEGVLSIVVLILLIALVWFGGEFLKTPENDLFKERVAIIAILIGIWVALFIAQKAMAIKNAVRIEKQLTAQSGSQLAGADADRKSEIEALGKKFTESLDALKKTKGGKSALFTLPWYVIIGPPGSGKTTALQESGLNFPAVQGGAKVRGIGGTRNCDWWFTEDGILLDTAGRYTTVAEDQDEWFAFLDMIRTSRKQKPINGAIVAIATDELFRATQGEIDQIAKDVRNRLDELAARLQAVFPVYMMFTKCDLIQGFVEYFEDFNKEQRSQVWGFTFPYRLPDKQYTDIFSEEVAKMGANIEARQLELLGSERPPHKKQNIYLFPRQLALAGEKMKEFLGSLFQANAFQESAMLRGIYFTSGTQKGTPIDQILARMGEAMGMSAAPGADDRVEKKSFFIHDLFTQIIFSDRTLARSSSRVIRKRRAMQLGLSLASLLALVLMGWVLLQSFVGNHEIISDIETAGVEVRDLEPRSRATVDDLQKLDKLRQELAEIAKYQVETRPIRLSFGMYQGNTMFEAGASVYFRRLRPLYISPTGERIEQELAGLVQSLQANSPSEDYQRLLDLWRVYRMLGGELEPQPALISTVLKKESRWTGLLSGSSAGEIESLAGEQLEFYASQLALTDKSTDPFALYIGIDPQLSKRAADKLQTAFWNASAYDAIIQFTSEKRKPLQLRDLVPVNYEYLELRTEGTDATNLSRLNAFTQEAWDTEIKGLIEERATDLSALFTELGMEKRPEAIRTELYERHRTAHTDVWNLFLQQVYPKASLFGNVTETNEALKVLTADASPYRDLVRNVWAKRTLTLAVDVKIDGPDETETKALDTAMTELGKFKDAYNLYWTKTGGKEKGRRVMAHLDNKEPLPAIAEAFIAAARDIPKGFPTRDEVARTAFLRVVDVAFDAVKAETDEEVKWSWDNGVKAQWKSSFQGKFPFVLKGTTDVTMINFSRMFAPKNGILWIHDRRVRAVEQIVFHNSRKLIALTQEYDNTIRLAADITDAMYDTEQDDAVKVRFSAKLTQTGLLVESLLEIGSDAEGKVETLPYNKYPNQTRDFVWTQWNTGASKMGARVTAKYTEAKKALPGKDLIETEWGLLKLLRSPWAISFSETEKDGMPKYSVLWQFTSPDQQLFYLQCELTPRKKQNPFREDLFTIFTLAETVSK